MSIAPIPISRVSNLQSSNAALQQISITQQQLQLVEEQLSTGLRVNQPSDDPSSAAMIQQLQLTAAQQANYISNVNAAQSQLGETDSTLSDLTSLLQQAQTIASANVSSTVTAAARASAATVVDSLYSQALTMANKEFNGTYLFAGDLQTQPPYVAATGGVQFVGSTTTLKTTIDQNSQLEYQISGADIFGGTSSQVTGTSVLSPALLGTTRLSDLQGATNSGFSPGSIQIGNGTASATIDLSNASTINDVLNAINNAALPGVTASPGQYGIVINSAGGANVTVNEVGGGTTAASLGILQTTAAGANVSINGTSVGAIVTGFTPLSALRGGAGIDTTGFTIQNGTTSKTIALSPSMTVEDLINEINGAGLGVTAQINSAGTGINILNAVQGTSMTISENGGTSASDLGIRSFTPSTPLAQLNDGTGVSTVAGNNFSVTTADGSVINVPLNNPVTVQDVLNQMNAAAGGKFTASISTNGNGIVLTDNTTGAGTLTVTPLNASPAAKDLGLLVAPTGNQINGNDPSGITVPGIFTDLQNLRDALRTNSQTGITTAAEGLQADATQVTQVQGKTGAMEQELQQQSTRLTAENTSTQAMISQVQDVDYATATTQFQQLQDSLQAALAAAGKTLNLSLMDYITT
jgi:flagellar hook-associated protein 3 FlgL